MSILDRLEEEMAQERRLGCERLLYIMGLLLGLLGLGICFMAIFYIVFLK